MFDATGWALEDEVVTERFFDYGRELGCGTRVPISSLARDPHNPYAALDLGRGKDRPVI